MLVEFSIFPVGQKSFSKPVAKVIDLIDKSGLSYQTTGMSTLIEGDWNRVFKLIKKCNALLKKEYPRVYGVIKFDDRRGSKKILKSKVDRAEQVLKRKVRR